jgi:hypothetical protein
MILVMTDRLTNYVKIEPMYKTATARDVADILYQSWYRQFGLPQAITCDRDKLFISKFWTELFKKIDIQLRMSTAYHPETDGSSERSNKTVIEALRHYVNVRQSDWADHLIHVETVMNNSVNATTSKTPTELLYGTSIRLFPSPMDKTSINVPAVADYIDKIEESIAIARDHHAEAKTRQTTYANRYRREEPEYKAEISFIWTLKIYGCASSKRAVAPSSTLDLLDLLKSLMQNQERRHTSYSYLLNTLSIRHFMPSD